MQYVILKSESSEALERLVNERLKKGWKPHGDLKVLSEDSSVKLYVQAMTYEQPV